MARQPDSIELHKRLRADVDQIDELLGNPAQMGVAWTKLNAFSAFCRQFEHPKLDAQSPFFVEYLAAPFGAPIAVVGLNTTLLSFDDSDAIGNLALGRGQLLHTVETQSKDTLLLVLQHHPSDWLRDGKMLNSILEQFAHIQFCGHVHSAQGILHQPFVGGSRLQIVAGAGHYGQREGHQHSYSWGGLGPKGLAYYPFVWSEQFHRFMKADIPETAEFRTNDHVLIDGARLPSLLKTWFAQSGIKFEPGLARRLKYTLDNTSFYIPFRQIGSHLVGRTRELNELTHTLSDPSQPARVALSGIGGLGKTQLVAEYCHRNQHDHLGGIYWLDAAQNLEGQIIALSDRAKWMHPESQHSTKLAAVIRRIQTNPKSLIVFDNVVQISSIAQYLPEKDSGSRVLVISRTEVAGWRTIRIDPLTEAQSLQLLEDVSGRRYSSPEETAAARAIAAQLDGLPLALELVGAYLKRRPVVSWFDCAQDLAKRGLYAQSLNWQGLEDASVTSYGANLHAALSLDGLLIAENPLLRAVLDVLTWLGEGPVGIELLSKLVGDPDSSDLLDALALGEQLRIVTLAIESGASRRFRLHSLVRQVRQQDIERPQGTKGALQIHRILAFFVSMKEDYHGLPTFERELTHLSAFWKHAELVTDWALEVKLRLLEAHAPLQRGKFRDALTLLRSAHETYIVKKVSEQSLEAALLHDLAQASLGIGMYRDSLNYALAAVRIRRKLMGGDHLETATSLCCLSLIHYELGNYRKALHNASLALRVQRKKLPEKDAAIASTLSCLGGIHRALGDRQLATSLEQEALEVAREALGPNDPMVASTLTSLAVLNHESGQREEALRLAQEAIEMWESLGNKQPEEAVAIGNLGAIYRSRGEYEKALNLEKRVLDIRVRLLGNRHPETARALDNIGATYSCLGRNEEALEVKQQALAIRREVLGEKHPYTASSLSNVGGIYVELGRFHEALPFVRQALQIRRKVFGERHIQTARSLVSLGGVFIGVGQREDGLRLLEQGHALQAEMLGARHAITTETGDFLAAVRAGLGTSHKKLTVLHIQAGISPELDLTDLVRKRRFLFRERS